jgi:hypothetical protein
VSRRHLIAFLQLILAEIVFGLHLVAFLQLFEVIRGKPEER